MKADIQSRIFTSYSHRGNGPKWKAALLHALQVFERHHLLDVWEDGKIRVSSFWDDDIMAAMGSAQLAVILLTDEALKSEYIVSRELPFLKERQSQGNLPVIPVVCEPCDWKSHDWLRATQAPNASNPLSELSEQQVARVFRTLATDIAEQLSHIAFAEVTAPHPPSSPTRVYLDKFPLTRGANLHHESLFGREQELALLDLAFAQPHTAIVSLVAWGGVGKTMLVQHWLQRLEREGWFGARCVYAWSFYSQGTKEDRQASEDTFLAHALEWFGVQCEPTLSPWDKGRLLADAIARERTLLILDGIEPLQYPPGPMGGQLRAPGVQSLLKQLARKANDTEHRGLCLVTTREPLTDLTDFERRPAAAWGSVLRVDLGNLTEEAGAALLHHAGAQRAGAAEIKRDDAELLAASREVDSHALTLNLLGRFLARAHNGDIRRRDVVKFEEADRKEQGGTTFKMLAAFENWFARSGEFGARQLAVLRMLGLFDRPADIGCIAALRQSPVIAGLTDPLFHSRGGFFGWGKQNEPLPEEDWNTVTSFLADFGLIAVHVDAENANTLLDCHPLIREHFAEQLHKGCSEAWHSAHSRLFAHLRDSTPDKPEPTVTDLQPLYQAVTHGCRAGLYGPAGFGVYVDRIQRGEEAYGWRKLGAYSSDLAAISTFFEEPWSRVIADIPVTHRDIFFHSAAFCLKALGRALEAVIPMRTSLRLIVERGDWRNAAVDSGNLSELELLLGEVPSAVRDAEQSVVFADRLVNPFQQMSKRVALANALHQAGRRSDAEGFFRDAERVQSTFEPMFPLLYSTGGFSYCNLLLTIPERAAWRRRLSSSNREVETLPSCVVVEKRSTRTLSWMEQWRGNSLLDIALDHLTLSRAALFRAILEADDSHRRRGISHADAAVRGFQNANRPDYLPHAFLARAWLRCLVGDPAAARADLDEAWDIAERGPMRLHLADIHLYRARLFFREKHYPWKSPQDDLAAAEKLINDCGYHRRDEELADAKRAILGEGT